MKCKECKWFEHPNPSGVVEPQWCYNFGWQTEGEKEACYVGMLKQNRK